MSEIKWIKITTDIFDDEKIMLIESLPEPYAIITVWFKLLCLAGKQNNHGVFMMSNSIAYTDRMLSVIFRMPESTVKLALETFENFGMIEIINGVITIPNWEKHQTLDSLEKKREYQKEWIRQKRNAQKSLCQTNGKVDSNIDSRVDVDSLEREEDKDKEKEEDKEIDKKRESKREKKSSRFSPPTIDEIKDYCCEKNYPVKVAEPFFNYYDSKNWMVGKNKMSNWHSALAGWVGREKDFRKEKVDSVSKVESFV